MSKTIHQEVDFTASPGRVYGALTDSKQFTAFSGGVPADIEPKAGSVFKCFGGQITGRIIELVPNHRIVQAWHVAMWPEGVYSIVKFELEKRGSGTRLALDHTGFADEHRDHLDAGWSRMYWEPLKKYLA
jgi:uncharacterized protein YndB with AHSA1/START domain